AHRRGALGRPPRSTATATPRGIALEGAASRQARPRGGLMRPGVIVRDAERATPASAPTDIGQWFAVGIAERGPANVPVRVTSLTQFERTFGPRDPGSPLFDAMETFFREGGGSAYVARVVGPSATASTVTLDDAGSDPSLTVTASSPG